MRQIRRADDRGHANHGWLDSHHTFSFASYYDPGFMGFGPLRVINEDRVQPGRGFGTHPHRDMEIISYVLEGALEHKDSMGTGSVIRPGDVQLMSAGTGVTHSEFNASKTERVHFLQIWIIPAEQGTEPRYEQRAFSPEERDGRWRLLVSPEPSDDALLVGQDVRLYGAVLGAGATLERTLSPDRYHWLQVARGSVVLDGETLVAGDGVAMVNEPNLNLEASEDAELLLFDMVAL